MTGIGCVRFFNVDNSVINETKFLKYEIYLIFGTSQFYSEELIATSCGMLKQAFFAANHWQRKIFPQFCLAWPCCCYRPARMLPTRSCDQSLVALTKRYATCGRHVSVCSLPAACYLLPAACCLLFAATDRDPAEAEQAGQQCEGVWFRNNYQIADGLRECVGFPAHVEVVVNRAGPGAGAILGEKRKRRQGEGKKYRYRTEKYKQYA